jgi:hypothetical protein
VKRIRASTGEEEEDGTSDKRFSFPAFGFLVIYRLNCFHFVAVIVIRYLCDPFLRRFSHVYQKLPAAVFLRAADAIHLATAAESEFRIVYSNDAHLLAAAKYFGIEGRNVIGHAI